MNVSKKIFMGLIYIYISIAALSAENIIGVGLSFPIQNFSNYKSYTEELTGHGYAYGKAGSGSLSDTDLAGYQVAFNFKHIFDNKFGIFISQFNHCKGSCFLRWRYFRICSGGNYRKNIPKI